MSFELYSKEDTIIYRCLETYIIFCTESAHFYGAVFVTENTFAPKAKVFIIANQAIYIFFFTLLVCRCRNRKGIWFRVFRWQRD
nr:MAG TPA: hypothetical protein [Caudoviricetes sp.]